MNAPRWFRLGAKALHEVASIGYGGALAACLVINLTANRAAPAAFAAARDTFAAIAQYVLLPSMAVVVISGLIALAATRAYRDAGWAWVKAFLGLSTFEATMLIVGSSHKALEFAADADGQAALEALLRTERITMWLLVAISTANVVLAVWRPRLTSIGR